jgi:hypothetical protein
MSEIEMLRQRSQVDCAEKFDQQDQRVRYEKRADIHEAFLVILDQAPPLAFPKITWVDKL